ncbi:MAG: mltD [Cytophagaceae bacterium]|jgi:LysM repeat protein|nr:mltD [Cytophagaceae bacterium]
MKVLGLSLCMLLTVVSGLSAHASAPLDSIGVTKINNKLHVRYLVEPGETVYGISTKYKVPVSELLEINEELEKGLKVGQIINIPYTEALVQSAKKEAAKERGEDDAVIYKVQPGDTYYGISKRFGVTVEELMKLNNMELKAGQELVVGKKSQQVASNTAVTEEKKIVAVAEPKVEEKKVEPKVEEPKKEEPKKEEVKKEEPVKTVVQPEKKTEPAVTTTPTKKPYVSAKDKPNPFIGNIEPYDFNPDRKQVLVIPFDPYLYFSDADDEIAARSNMPRNKIREVFRRRMNALLNAEGYETIHLIGGRSKDSISDLNKIYGSVTYNYQQSITNPASRYVAQKEVAVSKNKSWITKQKDKVTGTEDAKYELPQDNSKYFGVIVRNPDFYNYFSAKYSIDYYIFINQFEVKTNYENCLDRAALNYERTFTTHFSIFDANGKQIAGNSFKTHYNSNGNYIYQIVSDNIPKITERILSELPYPNQ